MNGIKLTSALGSGKAFPCIRDSKMLLSSCLSYVSATTLVRLVYVSELAGAEMGMEGMDLDTRISWGWEVGTLSERIFMTLAVVSSEMRSLVLFRLLRGQKAGQRLE